MLRFTFGKGIKFATPEATAAIIPEILHRVWEKDNHRESVLMEMGQQGGVSGDCFVKVAYEAYVDRWHPHDGEGPNPLEQLHVPTPVVLHRSRLLRMKIKYRFWGTSLEGTRQVFTYTEILTDDTIEEYLNDELIDSRPNILGIVPVVHIANKPVSGSPWGLPDCQDIISINRQYNEIHLGGRHHQLPRADHHHHWAKASQLERGAKKIWAACLGRQGREPGGRLPGPEAGLEYMELLEGHEMVGIPVTALGQSQPISTLRRGAVHPVPAPHGSVAAEDRPVRARDRADQRVGHPTLAVKEPNS
jgi:hypothetical protein